MMFEVIGENKYCMATGSIISDISMLTGVNTHRANSDTSEY